MRELLNLLATVEQDIDEYGWDQPGRLITIDGRDDTLAVLATPVLFDDPFEVSTLEFAAVFAEQPELQRQLVEAQPHLRGFGFVYEAWAVLSEEDLKALAPHQSHADSPNAQEIRALDVAMLDGQVVHYMRARGATTGMASTWNVQGGPVMTAAVRLARLMAQHYPQVPQAAKEELARIERDLDALAAAEALQ